MTAMFIGGLILVGALWLLRVAQQNAALREAQVERWRAVLFDHGDAPRLIKLKGKVYKANGWPAYGRGSRQQRCHCLRGFVFVALRVAWMSCTNW